MLYFSFGKKTTPLQAITKGYLLGIILISLWLHHLSFWELPRQFELQRLLMLPGSLLPELISSQCNLGLNPVPSTTEGLWAVQLFSLIINLVLLHGSVWLVGGVFSLLACFLPAPQSKK